MVLQSLDTPVGYNMGESRPRYMHAVMQVSWEVRIVYTGDSQCESALPPEVPFDTSVISL